MVCSALLVTGCGRSITTDITNVVLKSPEELADVDRTPDLSLQGFEYKKLSKRTFDHLPYQYTYVNLRTGKHVGSTNERNSRRAQGLVRLYIGHYAFTKGGEKEREQARRMLLHDDNALTDELYSVFPNSVSWAADKYQLDATTANNYWAYSQTSSYDVAYFLGQLLDREPDATLLAVMRERQSLNPQQNYGSGVLPNIIGSQTAESDENKEYLSAGYGADFVAVGAVNTSKTTLIPGVRRRQTIPDRNRKTIGVANHIRNLDKPRGFWNRQHKNRGCDQNGHNHGDNGTHRLLGGGTG